MEHLYNYCICMKQRVDFKVKLVSKLLLLMIILIID